MHAIPNIPDSITRQLYAELCSALPPPPDGTPEARALRDQHAIAAVAHLLPENVAEANIAVLIVIAQARARAAFRAAAEPGLDPDRLRQCCAQAAAMMRQADSAVRTLMRMQAERQKAEDALRPAAMQRAGYWFRSASVQDEPPPDQEPAPIRPSLPLREGDGGRGHAPPAREYGAMTPAERYLTLYPDRAAAILAAGGLPARPTFPQPDPAVVTELLTSDSPLIRAARHAHPSEPIAA
jgi:hypothetical protein